MSQSKTTLVPYLCLRNAVEATEFYKRAFGAEVLNLTQMPDGKVIHAALSIDGATFFLCDEYPEHGGLGPQSLGNSPVTLHLQVADADAFYNRAVAAGCEVRMPLEDQFWGDRYGMVVDPYGHHWGIATTVREVTPEELRKAVASM